MRRIKPLVLCLLVLVLSTIFSNLAQGQMKMTADDDWIGEYRYNYNEGTNAGGMPVLIEYKIVVTKKGDGLAARFTADGYQSNTDYECRVEVQDNKLNLYVVRDLADHGGIEVDYTIKPGQLLASLVKTTVRGKPAYLFKNGKFVIFPDNIAAKNPVYFRRKK